MPSSGNDYGNGYQKDVETGDPAVERGRIKSFSDPKVLNDLDEYTALQRYITSYRDPKAAVIDDEDGKKGDEDAKKGKKSWQFWKSGGSKDAKGSDAGVVPDDWLNTDISKGISNTDVENRRRKFGWNELTTEKENMLKKFLGYFTGPVLYGKYICKAFLKRAIGLT
jgi:H+-transporting ATPase